MKILAMDTSSFPASVAIAEDGTLLGEYIIRHPRKHSQNIMVMTERLMADLGIDISEIDVFAVTVGPGSFTGLRIGISTIRAFAQAMGKPVAVVNTLEALAYNVSATENAAILPLLDARRDEVYCAAYRFSGGVAKEILAPCVMTVAEVAAQFGADKAVEHGGVACGVTDGVAGGVVALGDGAALHKDELPQEFGLVAVNLLETRASSVAAAAFNKAAAGELCHYNEVEPLYLRKSQAEREYEGRSS